MLFNSICAFLGLMMTLVCGGELFTGNTVFLVAAVAEKKATFKELVKNWTLSYTGNVIGALFMVRSSVQKSRLFCAYL